MRTGCDAPSPLSRPAPPTGGRDVLRVRVGVMASYFLPAEPLTYADAESLLRDLVGNRLDEIERRMDSLEGKLDQETDACTFQGVELRDELDQLRSAITALETAIAAVETEP